MYYAWKPSSRLRPVCASPPKIVSTPTVEPPRQRTETPRTLKPLKRRPVPEGATLYQPLASDKDQIRVVWPHHVRNQYTWDDNAGDDGEDSEMIDWEKSIACTLKTFDMDDPRLSYTAISYAWVCLRHSSQCKVTAEHESQGSPETRTIYLNDHKVAVRRNLYDFLSVCRPQGYLWIDSICIDQDNSLERNHQVGMMGKIYAGASQTILWLGLDPHDGLAFKTLYEVQRRDQRYADRSHLPLSGADHAASIFDDNRRVALHRLLNEPYWQRHWILQEILLSKHRKLAYGTETMPWWEFSDAALAIMENAFSQIPFRIMQCVLNLHNNSEQWQTWYWCITYAEDTLCLDARDKVYGMQNMFDPQIRIEVDYSAPVQEVFIHAICAYAIGLRGINEWLFPKCCNSLALGMGLALKAGFDKAFGEWYLRRQDVEHDNSVRALRGILQTYLVCSDSSGTQQERGISTGNSLSHMSATSVCETRGTSYIRPEMT